MEITLVEVIVQHCNLWRQPHCRRPQQPPRSPTIMALLWHPAQQRRTLLVEEALTGAAAQDSYQPQCSLPRQQQPSLPPTLLEEVLLAGIMASPGRGPTRTVAKGVAERIEVSQHIHAPSDVCCMVAYRPVPSVTTTAVSTHTMGLSTSSRALLSKSTTVRNRYNSQDRRTTRLRSTF